MIAMDRQHFDIPFQNIYNQWE